MEIVWRVCESVWWSVWKCVTVSELKVLSQVHNFRHPECWNYSKIVWIGQNGMKNASKLHVKCVKVCERVCESMWNLLIYHSHAKVVLMVPQAWKTDFICLCHQPDSGRDTKSKTIALYIWGLMNVDHIWDQNASIDLCNIKNYVWCLWL